MQTSDAKSWLRHRIGLAYATAGLSKLFSAAVYLVALPIVAASLGPERLGLLMMIAAVGNMLVWPALGLSPNVANQISTAVQSGRDKEAEVFQATVNFSLLLAIVLPALVVAASHLPVMSAIFGAEALKYADEIHATLYVVALFLAAYACLLWMEGLRAGYMEQFATNILSALSALAIVALTAKFAADGRGMPAFFFSIFVLPVLIQGVNLVLVLMKRPYLMANWSFDRAAMQRVAKRAFMTGIAQGLSNFRYYGIVWLLGYKLGLEVGAAVGALLRAVSIANSVLLSLAQPIATASNIYMKQKNAKAAERILRAVVTGLAAMLAVFGLILAVGGNEILHLWIGTSLEGRTPVLIAISLFAAIFLFSNIMFFLLTGIGEGAWVSRRLIVESLISSAAFLILIYFDQPVLALVAQSACILAITGLSYPLRLVRALQGTPGEKA